MATARFPKDFTADPLTDYMKFKTVRRDYGGGNGGYTAEPSAETNDVILYMPQKISEGIAQLYRNTRLGPEASSVLTGTEIKGSTGNLGLPALGAGQGNPGGYNFGDMIKRMVESSITNKISDAMSKIGADSLDANAILSATSGVIYNPMMEVLYDGPAFRKFNYQFFLFAKSSADAKEIYKIVRFFQEASVPSQSGSVDRTTVAGAVSTAGVIDAGAATAGGVAGVLSNPFDIKNVVNTATSSLSGVLGNLFGGSAGNIAVTLPGGAFSGGRFITQPPAFEITYYRGANLHPYIDSPERCFLESMTIDYTPTGNYTILDNFDDTKAATTVGTLITLNFTEIKIRYKEDYGNPYTRTS